jgi:hypothetical protein
MFGGMDSFSAGLVGLGHAVGGGMAGGRGTPPPTPFSGSDMVSVFHVSVLFTARGYILLSTLWTMGS